MMGRVAKVITVVALVACSLPTLVVLISSFSSGKNLDFPPPGLSVHGYSDLLRDHVVTAAMIRSLIVGIECVLLSLPIGIAAAFAINRYRVPGRSAMNAFLLLGFSVPLVVSGMGFLVLLTRLGLIGSLWPMSVAVVTVNFPFMLLAIGSSIDQLNPELEEAAKTMGAEKVQTFLFVTLPGVMPGVLVGSIMLFIFGVTDFLVSLIIATTANQTLPVVLFASLRGALKPRHAAAGGLYIWLALVVVFLMTRFRSLEQFLYRRQS
jgi:putative spermidine/putrescine transport system permease protein